MTLWVGAGPHTDCMSVSSGTSALGIAGDEPGPVRTSLTVVVWNGQVHDKYQIMAISEVDASGSTGSEPVVEAIVLDKVTKTRQFFQ